MKTLLLACCLLAPAATLAADAAYHSKAGHFSLKIPEGWEAIPDDVLQGYNATIAQAAGHSGQAPSFEAAFQPREAKEWLEYPHVFIQFRRDLRLTPEQLSLMATQQGKAAANRQWHEVLKRAPDIGLLARANEVSFDPARNALVIRMSYQDPEEGDVIGTSAYYLTARGTIIIAATCLASQWEAARPAFNTFLAGVTVDKGFEYVPPPPSAGSDDEIRWYQKFRLIRVGLLFGIIVVLYLAGAILRRRR